MAVEITARTRITRLKLIRATGRAVLRRGLRDATVADIVDEASLSRRTFYQHFRSKEDACLELYQGMMVDLVGAEGCVPGDVDRAIRCVEKTAALEGRFGDNARPILIWHPSGYPEGDTVDDTAVFEGLVEALTRLCGSAEKAGVDVAVEITRAGSVGSAETWLHLKDRVPSPALKVM